MLGGPKGDCWVWTGGTNGHGYGRISIGGVDYGTHRVAYERLFDVKLDRKTLVRHNCDHPPCWNPEHLLTGTAQDNFDDMISRGRWRATGPHKPRYGDKHPHAKLSVEAVMEVRELYTAGMSQNDLAKRYGVDQSNISRAINGKLWSHV